MISRPTIICHFDQREESCASQHRYCVFPPTFWNNKMTHISLNSHLERSVYERMHRPGRGFTEK